MIGTGNAPRSRGAGFADDPRNPPWYRVLRECTQASCRGIGLGSVGCLPEDPVMRADALLENRLALIGGAVFHPFHDPDRWDDVMDGAARICRALRAHGARHLVSVDPVSPRRAPTAGRGTGAERMDRDEWVGFRERIATVSGTGTEEFSLMVSIHAHVGGFPDFEPERERLLDGIDRSLLRICLDTGHHTCSGYDPVAFMERHMGRIAYVHSRDIGPVVGETVIAYRAGFHEACAQGIFSNRDEGAVDFPAVRRILLDAGFEGWCTVERDCDPSRAGGSMEDARRNRDYLRTIGFN